jgi:hypothetical protein
VNAGSDASRRTIGRVVGEDLSQLPGVSALGALFRTARLSCFEKHEFSGVYGLRLLAREDPSHVLAFSSARKNTLARALGICTNERALWDLKPWLPFSGTLDWNVVPWSARLCPICARVGYHSLLFQLPWIKRCPWHRVALIRHCRRCGQTMSAAMSAMTIGECACKLDLFKGIEACRYNPPHMRGAATWIERYLEWADQNRGTRTLLHADNPELANFEALSRLVELPSTLSACSSRSGTASLHERHVRCSEAMVADTSPHLALIGASTDDVVELPGCAAGAFRRVGYNLAEKLPNATLSDGEYLRFFAGAHRPSIAIASAQRPTRADVIFLPVQKGGTRAFLYTNSLAKYARQLAQSVGALVTAGHVDASLAATVGMALLLRAYAEGLRVVLSRFIAELFAMPRDRPRLTSPWILLTSTDRTARIVWVPLIGDHQGVLVEPVRNNPRRPATPLVLPNRKSVRAETSEIRGPH